MNPLFNFKKLTRADVPCVFKWLELPHVAQWWRETKDYETFCSKYEKRLHDPSIGLFLMRDGQKPIGFIQWYNARNWRAESFPDPTFGIDLFIADLDYVGKGYAAIILRQFIDDIIMPMQPKKIIVDPEVRNARSIHIFEKIGFIKMQVVHAVDETEMVTVQLMELDV